MASARSSQEETNTDDVVRLRYASEVELQSRIQECVIKTRNDKKESQNDPDVAEFNKQIVKILEQMGIDAIHLEDACGVVIDTSQVHINNGLYHEIENEIGEYRIKEIIKEEKSNCGNDVFKVTDEASGLTHIMKIIPLDIFSRYKELQCMLDSRIKDLIPKLYAIYLNYPYVHFVFEFLQKGVTMEKFMKEVIDRIRNEMEKPCVFHLCFIKACLENIKTIKECCIVHNDLTEGNIMIVLARDRTINIKYIDFEMAFTWDGDQPDDDNDIQSLAYLLQKYFTKDLLTFAKELIKEDLCLPAERILRILREINSIMKENKIKTKNNEIDLMEDLRSVLDEIDESGDQRKKLFNIIEDHVNKMSLDPGLEFDNLEIWE